MLIPLCIGSALAEAGILSPRIGRSTLKSGNSVATSWRNDTTGVGLVEVYNLQ